MKPLAESVQTTEFLSDHVTGFILVYLRKCIHSSGNWLCLCVVLFIIWEMFFLHIHRQQHICRCWVQSLRSYSFYCLNASCSTFFVVKEVSVRLQCAELLLLAFWYY